MTRGGESSEFCCDSRSSRYMASRISQESFEKREQKDRCDRANACECNLSHVGMLSTERATLQFTTARGS
jgi:hypothetical protein